MSYKPSGAYYGQFTTQRFDTGVATDADSLPTATAARNGSDDGAFTLTVAKLDTGRYKVTGTVPAGYAAGDVVQVCVAASVNGVSGKAIVDSFVVDSKHNADLNDFDPATETVDVGSVAGANVTGPDDLKADVSSLSTFDPAVDEVIVGDFTAGALGGFLLTDTGSTYSSAVAGSVAKEIAENTATAWSVAERGQIRFRLGLDGDKTSPSSTGDLSDIKLIVQAGVNE